MKRQKILALVVATTLVSVPAIAFAAGLVPCDGVTKKCDFTQLAALINNIIKWFIGISISVATVALAYAGGQMLLNPDNPKLRGEMITAIKNIVIGMVLVLAAWLIIHTIVTALFSNSSSALRFLTGS